MGLPHHQDEIHVTIPATRRIAATAGVRLHRSRWLDASQVHPVLEPPRTRVERTVLDLVDAACDFDRTFAIAADACRKRLTTPPRLRTALAASPDIRWRAPLLSVLDDIASGSHTLLERHFLILSRRHHLPIPDRQVRVVAGRRTSWVDCDYGGLRVRVELDGRIGHDPALDRFRDMGRDNRAAMTGILPLRYGWADAVGQPCEVAGQVAVVLALRGWDGTAVDCGAKCTLQRQQHSTAPPPAA